MSSLRKKYRPESATTNDAPVQSAPSGVVERQSPSATDKQESAEAPPPPEQPGTEPDAVKEAEQNAIALKLRLQEMDRAENLQQEALTLQQRMAAEPKRQAPEMPAHVQAWLADHPQYLNDALAQAELNLATMKAVRAGKTWHDKDFIEAVEQNLGLRPATNGAAHDQPPMAAPTPRLALRNPPRQHFGGPPVSAPPTRDTPSMTTGRAQADMRLTREESDLARSLNLSDREYAEQKARMNKLKAAGVIQDGR